MRPAAIADARPDARAGRAAGAGAVVVARGGARGRSVIARAWAVAPLVLLEPRNHGVAAWLFAGTLGGGLVDGDAVAIDAHVAAGAALVLATQASTKIYRGAARQAVRAQVDDDGLLVAVPDPVACFAGARYQQDSCIALAATGSLVWLDALTCGRRAHGERWAFRSYRARTVVRVDGVPRVHDATLLDRDHGDLAARMGGVDAIATIVAVGPRARGVAETILAAARAPLGRGADAWVAVSPITGGAIARIAGVGVEPVTRAVRGLLAGLGELLGDDPFRGRG